MSRKLTPERQVRNDRWGFGVGDNTADGGLMMEDGVSTDSEREQVERDLAKKLVETDAGHLGRLWHTSMDLTLRLRAAEKALDNILNIPAVKQVLGVTHTQGCGCSCCKARAALAEIRRKP